MASRNGQQPPMLGATFIPGGFDDFYLPAPPDVVSPAPQRIMPEVPEQIQENIAHLELEANETISRKPSVPVTPTSSVYSQPSPNAWNRSNQNWEQNKQAVAANSQPPLPPRGASLEHSRTQPVSAGQYQQLAMAKAADEPNFSPFPPLQNPPPNVPPTDEAKESILENARLPVLNSNDPEMQLAWAQDALAYVDASMLHEERMTATQPARPATPQVEHQLRADAMNIVSFLAEQHHPKAEFIKGMWLEFGKFGMRQDKKEAFRSYSRAADRGYARAEYRIGMQFEQANDPVKALIHYKRGSEAGDSASNYRLGMMTLLGQHGQPQDYAEGVRLIRIAAQAADENAPQGAYVLGMLQARELPQINVPEIYLPYSEAEAKMNIEKAAYLGFAKAQLKMGSAYELCTLGCEFNPALALHFNALAARQGEPEAEMAISKWFLCGYDGIFQKNEELAYSYAQRAAQSGLSTAEFAMGYFNEIGMYVPVSIGKAMEWYQKAASNGNKDAESRMAEIQKSRPLNKKDHENIAINRIKSQYGSKRGERPARFQAQAPQLPTIRDDSGDSTPRIQSPPVQQRPPTRNQTTTPYPIDDRPPTLGPGPVDRQSSTTPYPVNDGPPAIASRPAPTGGFFATPEQRSATAIPTGPRPTSAFNINVGPGPGGPPGGRNSYGGPGGPGDYGGPGGPGGYGNGGPPRPYSTLDAGRGRPPQGLRLSPAPPGAYPPRDYRQPGAAPSVERPEDWSPPPAEKPAPLKINIGYSAPDDPKGRGRLQKPGPASANKPLPDIGFEAPVQAKPTRPTIDRPASANPGQQSRPSTSRPDQQRPPMLDRPATTVAASGRSSSRPTTGSARGSRPGSSGRPTKHDPMPSPQPPAKTQSAPVQQKPAAAKPAAPAKTPGKGPKTFDEMGIAQTKEQGDCVVM